MSYHDKYLKFLYWNADSLRKKIHELYRFLQDNQIDICCISETCFNTDTLVPSHPQFVTHRFDRPQSTEDQRTAGGVAIIIRKSLKHTLVSSLPLKLLQCVGVKLQTNRGNFEVFSVYLPGGANRTQIEEHYENDIRKLTTRSNPYVIAGDLNSQHRSWNCQRSNVAGRILFDQQQRRDFLVLFSPNPTHFPYAANASPSTIDLLITNALLPTSNLVTHESASDHSMVTFTIELDQSTDEVPGRLIPDYKNANWQQYKSIVHEMINPQIQSNGPENLVSSKRQIDCMILKLTETMQYAKSEAIPMIRPARYSLHLPNHVMTKIRHRNRLRRQAKRYPALRAQLTTEVNHLQKEIQNEIERISNSNYNHMLSKIPDRGHPQKMWKLSKFLKNRKKFMPPLKHENQTYTTPTEKCEVLASSFAENFKNPLESYNQRHTRRVDQEVEAFLQSTHDDPIDFATKDELNFHIARLKLNRAPGEDQISNRLIKNLPPSDVTYLLIILNSCLRLSYFPQVWKNAKVIAIKKPEKPPNSPLSFGPSA